MTHLFFGGWYALLDIEEVILLIFD